MDHLVLKRPASCEPEGGLSPKRRSRAPSSPEEGELDDTPQPSLNSMSVPPSTTNPKSKVAFPFKKKGPQTIGSSGDVGASRMPAEGSSSRFSGHHGEERERDCRGRGRGHDRSTSRSRSRSRSSGSSTGKQRSSDNKHRLPRSTDRWEPSRDHHPQRYREPDRGSYRRHDDLREWSSRELQRPRDDVRHRSSRRDDRYVPGDDHRYDDHRRFPPEYNNWEGRHYRPQRDEYRRTPPRNSDNYHLAPRAYDNYRPMSPKTQDQPETNHTLRSPPPHWHSHSPQQSHSQLPSNLQSRPASRNHSPKPPVSAPPPMPVDGHAEHKFSISLPIAKRTLAAPVPLQDRVQLEQSQLPKDAPSPEPPTSTAILLPPGAPQDAHSPPSMLPKPDMEKERSKEKDNSNSAFRPQVRQKKLRRTAKEEHFVYGRMFVGCGEQSDYDVTTKLGEGTFGEVHKARHRVNGKAVALKRIMMHNEKEGMPVTALREIKILKALHHPCIVELLDMFVVRSKGKEPLSVYMVFPYMDHDLAGLLENDRLKLQPSHIKLYMKQLLEGTNYMHQNHILHRDMKAANLLISNDGTLKIADFGLARSFSSKSDKAGKERKYTNCVVTRWYRPPELLLGARQYGGEVDIWGVGCVFAEMFARKPILPGSSDTDQLDKIWALCGTPNQIDWPHHDTLPAFETLRFKQQQPRRLRNKFSGLTDSEDTLDLLDKLLVCNPKSRLTAEQALLHDYFWTDPLPADLGSMPIYEPSHEFDKRARRPPPPDFRPPPQNRHPGPIHGTREGPQRDNRLAPGQQHPVLQHLHQQQQQQHSSHLISHYPPPLTTHFPPHPPLFPQGPGMPPMSYPPLGPPHGLPHPHMNGYPPNVLPPPSQSNLPPGYPAHLNPIKHGYIPPPIHNGPPPRRSFPPRDSGGRGWDNSNRPLSQSSIPPSLHSGLPPKPGAR